MLNGMLTLPVMLQCIGNKGRGNRLRVPKLTLDDALPWRDIGAPFVHFIKIDTQGWELRVLKGAMQLLAAQGPILAVRVQPVADAATGN